MDYSKIYLDISNFKDLKKNLLIKIIIMRKNPKLIRTHSINQKSFILKII